MGAVYVAEHILMGRKVAIKRLHPELASDEKAVQRFHREARAAAATGHEHIVEILDLGNAEDGAPYLVMEYLRGQTLAALLRKEQRLDAGAACDLVGQALAALEAVHREGILHRDLKPDNLFLTRGTDGLDWVKILDFGISKVKHEEGEEFALTRTGVMLGTPFYMSPEQARGMKLLDHRIDLYAMGMILYECLTGRVAFEGDNYHQLLQSILRTPPPAPRSIAPDIDVGIDALIMKAIAKDPNDRFQSASEMLSALQVFRTASSRTREHLGFKIPSGIPNRSATPSFGELSRGETNSDGSRTTSGGHAHRSRPSPSMPRYYFAASGDWDEGRARAAIRLAVAREPTPTAHMTSKLPRASISSRESPPRLRDLVSRDTSRAASSAEYERTPAREALSVREALADFSPRTPPPLSWSLRNPRVCANSIETELKGSLFTAALEHIETVHGHATLLQVRQQLDPELRERISGVILPMAWLPLSLYEQILRGTERTIGGVEGTTASGIGRSSADRELPTTHRLFMQSASPVVAIGRIPHFYRLYHSRGEAKVMPTPGAGVRVEIDALVPESLPYAWTLAGFWQRMLELTGAREVRAGVVSCRGRGDEKTAITLRWR